MQTEWAQTLNLNLKEKKMTEMSIKFFHNVSSCEYLDWNLEIPIQIVNIVSLGEYVSVEIIIRGQQNVVFFFKSS